MAGQTFASGLEKKLAKLTSKMSKTCSRCDKAVYPTEELKCLDKVIILFHCRRVNLMIKVDAEPSCMLCCPYVYVWDSCKTPRV